MDLIERLVEAAVHEEETVNRVSWHADLLREAALRLSALTGPGVIFKADLPPALPLDTSVWEIRYDVPFDDKWRPEPGWWMVAASQTLVVWVRRRT